MPYYTFFKIYPASFELAMRILAYPGKLDLAVDQVRDVRAAAAAKCSLR